MKKKIAIANTLKPVDDVRGFEKIAQSISKTNKYEINIIGNSGKKESGASNITFNAHSLNRSAVLKRISIRWQILFKLLKLRPSLLIITTHELVAVAVIVKLITRANIVYDVQEDYRKSIRYLSTLPTLGRILVSSFVRLKEKTAAPFFSQFWLAEICYQEDLKFTRDKSLVIGNLPLNHKFQQEKKQSDKVLFSGTISAYSEVLLAVKTYQLLAAKLDNPSLIIIGQCHSQKLLEQLEKIQQQDPTIKLKLSFEAVPHDEIVADILSSNLGIISYQENEVNKRKMPTKLYEYACYRLPYILEKDTNWASEASSLGGCIPIDFRQPDVDFIAKKLESPADLLAGNYPVDKTWEYNESQLISAIETLI